MSRTTKAYKVTVLVIDPNGEYRDMEQVKQEVEHRLSKSGGQVKMVQMKDVGVWTDEHPLNQRGTDWKKYFEN